VVGLIESEAGVQGRNIGSGQAQGRCPRIDRHIT